MKIPLLWFIPVAALCFGCGVAPEDMEYPIAPGRYYKETDVLAKGRDSSMFFEYSSDGTYYRVLRTSPDCMTEETKGTWYVFEGSFTKQSREYRMAPLGKCLDATAAWIPNSENTFYLKIKDITPTSFMSCEDRSECVNPDRWKKWIQ